MISDNDARQGYFQLLDVISKSRLSWIVPQIQEEISKGKVILKSIKDIPLIDYFGASYNESSKTSSTEKVSISEAYSNKEQLKVLLTALEEIMEVHSIRTEILTTLKNINPRITSVQFMQEETNTTIDFITDNILREEAGAFSILSTTIKQFKEEI